MEEKSKIQILLAFSSRIMNLAKHESFVLSRAAINNYEYNKQIMASLSNLCGNIVALKMAHSTLVNNVDRLYIIYNNMINIVKRIINYFEESRVFDPYDKYFNFCLDEPDVPIRKDVGLIGIGESLEKEIVSKFIIANEYAFNLAINLYKNVCKSYHLFISDFPFCPMVKIDCMKFTGIANEDKNWYYGIDCCRDCMDKYGKDNILDPEVFDDEIVSNKRPRESPGEGGRNVKYVFHDSSVK
jgi:hypothetical protein